MSKADEQTLKQVQPTPARSVVCGSTDSDLAGERGVRGRGHRKGLWGVVALAVLAALGFAGWLLLQRSTEPEIVSGDSEMATQTVRVSRGDVTAVLTIDGMLVANPHFAVLAPRDGVVKRVWHGSAGTDVRAGRVLFAQGGERASAPAIGSFVRWLIPDGVRVAAGVPVAEIAYSGFGVAANLPPEGAYRLYSGHLVARAEIHNGPGPFDCTVLMTPEAPPLPDPRGIESGDAGVGPAIICAVPMRIRAIAGLRAMIALQSAVRQDVLVLPLQAVAGTFQQGEVNYVKPDGSVEVKPVELGITDGAVVEITRGLREGDRVLTVAPHLGGQP